jgi:hypothetical protein
LFHETVFSVKVQEYLNYITSSFFFYQLLVVNGICALWNFENGLILYRYLVLYKKVAIFDQYIFDFSGDRTRNINGVATGRGLLSWRTRFYFLFYLHIYMFLRKQLTV